jgi:8-oxo-dGTP diphosphatase
MSEAYRQNGAYALVRDSSGRILLVRARSGRCYLPGGRIEPGEDARTALAREIEEECGWTAAVGARLGEARQRIMAGSIELEATYWNARLIAPSGAGAEHELLWLEPAAAVQLLHRTGDRAVVAAAAKEMESVA